MQETTERIRANTVIVGGGIAGLWLLNQLRNTGRDAVLLESKALGSDQTIASQGMIHGGVKYALGGALTGSSEAIGDMPARWRQCLAGEGEVDLRATTPLSEHFYLWSTAGIASKMTSFFASKLTRGRVENVAREQFPAVFDDPAFQGNLYKLVDLVLDVPSLLDNLARNHADAIFQIDWNQAGWDSQGRRASVRLSDNSWLDAEQFILTAGEGNEAILRTLGANTPQMQRRPLQQALVKHDIAHPLYAHCMGSNPSPRLTVSSHQCRDGRWVWYLGGDLATENTDASPGELIDKAKQELADLFPWLHFGNAEWATIKLDRAEPKQKALIKPDKAFAARIDSHDNVIAAWPTKLTLSPNLANEVAALLPEPKSPSNAAQRLQGRLPAPKIAEPCWETLF